MGQKPIGHLGRSVTMLSRNSAIQGHPSATPQLTGQASASSWEPVGLEESKRKFGWSRPDFDDFAGQ